MVEELEAVGECPADVAAQDNHVLAVIGDGFRAAVMGDLLSLSAAGGDSLVYGTVRELGVIHE